MGFYSRNELEQLGFKNIGDNVYISRQASIYGIENISIGSNVRIDDFCILSGKIEIKNYVHIGAGSYLIGGNKGIFIDNLVNISQRVNIFAKNDDYSGFTLTNPMVDDKYKNVHEEEVYVEKHVIIGTGCIILPGVRLKEGTAVGALSLVKKSTDIWSVYAGIPASFIKERCRDSIKLEKEFLNDQTL